MNEILEQFCTAYQISYKSNGAHDPLTTQIRQLIVRFWQGTGQQRIVDMNREFSNGATKRADATIPATGDQELKTFVHPKARAASETAKKPIPGGPTLQPGEKLGKLTRHMKAGLTGEPPHPLTGPEQSEQHQLPQLEKGKKVVAGDDPVTISPDAESGTTIVTKLTDAEIASINVMTPGDIVSQYGERWIKEKLTAHMIDHDINSKPNKLAAILKSKIKA